MGSLTELTLPDIRFVKTNTFLCIQTIWFQRIAPQLTITQEQSIPDTAMREMESNILSNDRV